VRFVFNRRAGGKVQELQGGSNRAENFSRVIYREAAFRFSEGLYTKLKTDISARIHSDIDRELDHMAHMFMYGVVGTPGRNRGPKGNLTTVAPTAEAMRHLSLNVPVKSLTGEWARRSPDYLRSRGEDQRWFQRHNPSIVERMRSAKTWTTAYGGIAVTIKKHETFKPGDPAAAPHLAGPGLLKGTRGGNARIGVATIQVEAMKRITTEMLPALAQQGKLNDYGSDPRGVGLLSLLGEQLAWRFGGNPATVPFRPTVQPFLSFFLKRQLPNAVLKRLEQGLQGRLTDGVGSAGRAQGAAFKSRDLTLGDYMPKR
jgi:hypothetical protein